jgi:acetyl esterase/lipase
MNISKGTGKSPLIQADLLYAGVGGTSLVLDLYTPAGATSGLPTLLHLHGGGWAVGDKSDAAVERLMPIVASGFGVASVNHRLVPSVRYPAPVHDVKAAVRWLRANAAEYGLDPDRIAIGGFSAGAPLASLTGSDASTTRLSMRSQLAG